MPRSTFRWPTRHAAVDSLSFLLGLCVSVTSTLGAWAQPATAPGEPAFGVAVTRDAVITTRDGTRLAADIYRPARDGKPGRLIFGIGAGWFERDYQEYGYDFGATPGVRLNALAEAMPRIEARWAKLNPAPTRDIPVLIGGGGEKKTLRIVAQHADIWHSFSDVETLNRKKAILAEHCQAIGRDVDEITLSAGFGQSAPTEVGDALVDAGVRLFTVGISGPDHSEGIEKVKAALAWRASL